MMKMQKIYDFFKKELDKRKKDRLKHFVFKPREYQKKIIDVFKAGLYSFPLDYSDTQVA